MSHKRCQKRDRHSKERKRSEAEERNSKTPFERTRAYRRRFENSNYTNSRYREIY